MDAEADEAGVRLRSLLDDAVDAHRSGPKHRGRLDDAVDALVDLDGLEGPGRHRPERALGVRLRATVADLWERGWEPADLGSVGRRQPEAGLTRLLTATIASDLSDPHRAALLPDRWRAQCAALGAQIPDATPSAPQPESDTIVIDWRTGERLDVGTAIERAVHLWAVLDRLPDLALLGPPPSRWAGARPGPRGHPGPGEPPGPASEPGHASEPEQGADPKLLTTIRALLAKAESTSFPAEAETFAAKAQTLMTNHAIDAAVLAATSSPHQMTGEVRVRRVPIDDPYGTEKAGLLHVVAGVNDVDTVWDDQLSLATIIGFPADLDVVELLFTSLLVQATRAVNDPANATPDRRAPSFRRAFLLAYADRIGQRLQRAHDQAGRDAATTHGTALAPILAARGAAVAAVTSELYPRIQPGRTRLVDGRGWAAGREAADRAHLRP